MEHEVTALHAYRKFAVFLSASMFAGMALALPLDSTDLFFTIDGDDLGIVPIAIETGGSDSVSYDLSSGAVSFRVADAISQSGRYTDPLFCFDFSPSVNGFVSLNVVDANGHPVIADLSLEGSLQYDLIADQIGLTPPAGVQCFYEGSASGTFGLFGQASYAPDTPPQNSIFGDKFLGEAVQVEFQGLPEFVTAGDEVNYQLVVSNVSGRTLENIGLQELFPANTDAYDATLVHESWNCSGSVQCPTGSLNSNGSLRFQGFDLGAGETMMFDIVRDVHADSEVGSEIDLYAGVIAADTPLKPFDTAQATAAVVGAGDSLAVVSVDATVGENALITVTALDAGQNPVPGIEVVLDDADGLQINPVAGTTTDPAGQVEYLATTTVADTYTVQFSSTDAGIAPGSGDVSFDAAAPDVQVAWADQNGAVADGVDEVLIKVYLEDEFDNPVPGVTVDVVDDGGLSSLPTSAVTGSNGVATLAANSEAAQPYLVEVGVVGLPTETVAVEFVAGAPSDFIFTQGPFDTTEGGEMSPAVIVQLIDDNDNWVVDNDTVEVTLQLRQGGSAVDPGLAALTVTDGQAVFQGLSMDGVPVGTDYYLRAFGTFDGNPLLEDSTTFDILAPVPDEVGVALQGFSENYEQGAQASGTVAFTYVENSSDIAQIFNVFRVLDDTGEEVDAATYDALFQSVSYGPAGYEDYIRPLSGSSAANVVAPETVDVSVDFVLEPNAPEGLYDLTLTSYDVTGEDPDDVSLGNADNGDYSVLSIAIQEGIRVITP